MSFYSCCFPLCSAVQPGLSQLPRRIFDRGNAGGTNDSADIGRIPIVFVIEFIPGGDVSVAILSSIVVDDRDEEEV